ncbi:hypothetical protein MMPV_006281 [Pyropia vietnamensis]
MDMAPEATGGGTGAAAPPSPIESLLAAFLTPFSATIAAAEAELRTRGRSPAILPELLGVLSSAGAPPALRQTAGVLLRRFARRHAPHLPDTDVRALLAALLAVASADDNGADAGGGSGGVGGGATPPVVRRTAVAAIVSLLPDTPNECAYEVLDVASRLASPSLGVAAREAAVNLADGVAELEVPAAAEGVAAVLTAGLADPALPVRLAAVKSVGTVLGSDWEGDERDVAVAEHTTRPLLSAALAMVGTPPSAAADGGASGGADANADAWAETATAVFGLLQELLEVQSRALRPVFSTAVSAAMAVLVNASAPGAARSAAGELVAAAAGERPKTFRRVGLVNAAVDAAVGLLLEEAATAGDDGDGAMGDDDAAAAGHPAGDDADDDDADDDEWRPGVLAARLLDALASEELLVNQVFARTAAVAQRVLAEAGGDTAGAAASAGASPVGAAAAAAATAARRAIAYRCMSLVAAAAGAELGAAAGATPPGVVGLMGALVTAAGSEAHPRPRAAAVRALASAAAALADGGGDLGGEDGNDAERAAEVTALAGIRDGALRAAVAALRDPSLRVRLAGCNAVECVLALYELDDDEDDDEAGELGNSAGGAALAAAAAGGDAAASYRPLADWVDEIAAALSAVGEGGNEAAVAAAAALADAAGGSLAASAAFPGLVTGVGALMARRGPDTVGVRAAATAAAGSLVAACADVVGDGGGGGDGGAASAADAAGKAAAAARSAVVAPLAEAALAATTDQWNEPELKEATFVFFARLVDAHGAVAAASVAGRLLPLIIDTLARDDGVITGGKSGGGDGGAPGGAVSGTDAGADTNGDKGVDESDSDGGDLVVSIRTAALDEKVAALEALGALAETLAPGGDLPPSAYARPGWSPPADYSAAAVRSAAAAAATHTAALHSYFHEEVRAGALRATSRLLAAAFYPPAVARAAAAAAPAGGDAGAAAAAASAAADAVAEALLLSAEAVDGDDDPRVAATGLAAISLMCASRHAMAAAAAAAAVPRVQRRLTDALRTLLRGVARCQAKGLDDSDDEESDSDGGWGQAVWQSAGATRQVLVDELTSALPAIAAAAPTTFAVDVLWLSGAVASAFCTPTSPPGDRAQAVGAMAETISRLRGGGGVAAAAAPPLPPPSSGATGKDSSPPPPSPEDVANALDQTCQRCLMLASAAALASESSALRRNGVYLLGVLYTRVRPASMAGKIIWSLAPDTLRILQARLEPVSEHAAAVRDNAAGALGRLVTAAVVAAEPSDSGGGSSAGGTSAGGKALLSAGVLRSATLLLSAALPLKADRDELLPVAAGLAALAVADPASADVVHVPAIAEVAVEALVGALLVVSRSPGGGAGSSLPSVATATASMPVAASGPSPADALIEGDVPRMVAALRLMVAARGAGVLGRLALSEADRQTVEAWLR